VNQKLQIYEIKIHSNPDEYSSGHSVKRALILLTVAIAICAVAMELVKMASITIPLPITLAIHAVAFVVLFLVYRWFQLQAQKR